MIGEIFGHFPSFLRSITPRAVFHENGHSKPHQLGHRLQRFRLGTFDIHPYQTYIVHGRYYLTEEATRRIRRDVYNEREMLMKPWLTWLAVLISVISLVVSVLKP